MTWSLWGFGLLFGCGILGTLVNERDGAEVAPVALVEQTTVTATSTTASEQQTPVPSVTPSAGSTPTPTGTKAAAIATFTPRPTLTTTVLVAISLNQVASTIAPTATWTMMPSRTTILRATATGSVIREVSAVPSATNTVRSTVTQTRLPSATATPLPTATIRPSPTMTLTPVPTGTPLIVPTATQTVMTGPVAKQNANLRAGPSTEDPVVGGVTGGESLAIVGQNGDGSWYQLQSGAWIAAFLVEGATGGYAIVASVPTLAPTVMVAATEPVPATAMPPAMAPSSEDAFTCVGGCAEPPPGSNCVIKGNVNSSQEKIYHVPGGQFYERTDIKPEEGDRWFCTAEEAETAGFRASQR